MKKAKKKMSRTKKIVLTIVITISSLIVLAIAGLVLLIFLTITGKMPKVPVTNTPISMYVGIDKEHVDGVEEATEYYDSFEEAQAAYNTLLKKEIDNFVFKYNILRIEDEDALIVWYVYEINGERKIGRSGFDKQGSQVSNCRYEDGYFLRNMKSPYPLVQHYKFTLEESIATEIIFSLMTTDCARANNDIYVIWGISDNEDVKTLTICGEEPNEVIEVKATDGTPYYFWYYKDLDVLTRLREDINFGSFYLGEVIDSLDIEVEERESRR